MIVSQRLLLFVSLGFLIPTLCCSVPKNDPVSLPQTKTFHETLVPDSDGTVQAGIKPNSWKIDNIIAPKANFTHVAFADKDLGWLAGPRALYRTQDGGLTWTRLPLELPPESVIKEIYLDSRNAWLVAQSSPRSWYDEFDVNAIELLLMATTDTGLTWETLLDERGVYFSRFTVNKSGAGAIAGLTYLNSSARETELFLRITADGGRSWIDGSKTANEAMREIKSEWSYQYDDVGGLSLEGSTRLKFITHSRRVLETHDRGVDWQYVSQYAHDDDQVGIKNFGDKDDGTEWMFESTYSIEGVRARLKTRDLSDHLTRNVVHGVYLSKVHYLGADSFIAAGQAGDLREDGDAAVILVTDDDGKNWFELYRNKKSREVLSLNFVTSQLLWAVCDNGTVLRLTKDS